ncbi:class I ribonucleotide reductase maintenance protein YfaE [Paraglaciecola aestuariivivens]
MSNVKNSILVKIIDQNTVTHTPNQSLLETLEQHNVEIQYHCREGYCGACRSTLISGEVTYTTDPLAFIDDDEILPCCCVPNQDIEIKLA